MDDAKSASRLGPLGALLGVAFFLSGLCGLGYELVWLRLTADLLGTTAAARGIVLATFMGGLGLGSYLAARILARRPGLASLRVYAGLELGIAAWALALPLVMRLARAAYLALHPGFVPADEGGTGVALAVNLLRIVLATLTLLPATTAMGATLPMVVHHFARQPERTGRVTGALYALNTIGAATGVLVTGLVLAPRLGWQLSNGALAALNAALAVVVLLVARGSGRAEDPAPDAGDEPFVPRHGPVPYVMACVAGLTGLSLEVLWMRALAVFTRDTALAHTAVLAVFIAGLAIGAALPGRRAHASRGGWAVLAATLLAVAAAAAVSPLVLDAAWRSDAFAPTMHAWGPLGAWGPVRLAVLVVLPGTLAMGATLPLLVSRYAEQTQQTAAAAGHIYAANTLGAVVGSVVTSFVLVPTVGTRWTLLAVVTLAALNAGFALRMHWRSLDEVPPLERAPAAMVSFAALSLALLYAGPRIARAPDLPLYPPHDDAAGALVFAQEDGVGLVEVVERRNGRRALRTDRTYAWGSEQAPMLRSMLRQGALPMLLHPEPARVLEVGLATGVQFVPVLAHEELEVGRVVELSPAIAAASARFDRVNGGLDRHPKFELVIGDGRDILAVDDATWDVIVLGLFTAYAHGVGALYSDEMLARAHARLEGDGMVVQWLPLDQLSEEALAAIVRTFLQEFDHAVAFEKAHYLALVGADVPLGLNWPRAASRMSDTHLGTLLAGAGLDRPELVLSTFVLDRDGLEALAGDAPINTLASDYVERHPPRHEPGSYRQASENLEKVLALRRPALGELLVDAPPAARDRLERLRRARAALLRSGVDMVAGDRAASRAALERAVAQGPEDPLIAEQARAQGL